MPDLISYRRTMRPAERLAVTFAGGTPDRVPVMPKIWLDLAAGLTGCEVQRVIEDPGLALRVLVDAAAALGVDGARQFLFPARRTLQENEKLYEIDAAGRSWARSICKGVGRRGCIGRRISASTIPTALPSTLAGPMPLPLSRTSTTHGGLPSRTWPSISRQVTAIFSGRCWPTPVTGWGWRATAIRPPWRFASVFAACSRP